MKAFVTGGTGFIGSHVVDYLNSQGCEEIRCLIRSKEKWLEGRAVTRVEGSLHDLAILGEAMQDVDVVFHIAGVVSAPDEESFDHGNVDATENVIRLARKNRVGKVVVLSSLAACGPSFGRPLTEEDPLMPITMYGRSKKRMEEMIHQTAGPEPPVTIVRPPAVYGPREEQIYMVFKMASTGFFPVIGDGRGNSVDMIHVDDLVDGIIRAAEYEHKGVETFFVSSEASYSWLQIRDEMARAMGRKVRALKVRPGLVKNLASMIESASSLWGHYPVINREKSKEMTMEWTCSVDKASRELGFRQRVPLEQGLATTLDWYKRHNWL